MKKEKEPRDTRFAVRLSRSERRQVVRVAKEEDRPCSQILRQAFLLYLSHRARGTR